MANAGNRALGAVINKYRHINGLGYYTYSKLYTSGVCPILDYCCESWGYKKFKEIDAIQNKAIRVYLGVHRFAPLLVVNGDMGWTNSHVRRKLAMFRFWNRLIKMPENRLPKIVFNWDMEQSSTLSWSKQMRSLFESIDLIQHFDNREHVCTSKVWALLHENFCKKWAESISNKPKLRTYTTFKDIYQPEPFAMSLMSKKQRSFIAQLRCGILPLQIEVGRWTNKNLADRVCLVCDSGQVECEHFVFKCDYYVTERQRYYNMITESVYNFCELSETDKLKICMSKEHVVEFSRFFMYNI